ncbi:MAG: threonine synthase, partial [Candidatus Micrarchaeota archaeon]
MHSIILKCIKCAREFSASEIRYECACGGLLDVVHDLKEVEKEVSRETFDARLGSREFPYGSAVWRFRELVLPYENNVIVSKPEGNTNLYSAREVIEYAGVNIQLKHEGENPTGSFKDRGMTSGVTQAKFLGCKVVACASTGNTSASLAAYAAKAGMKCVVFIPEGKIAYGKLSQALAYGAKTLQVRGNFDDSMKLVKEASAELNLYLMNSVNPFRLEGQKTIMLHMLQQRNWKVPDWMVLPGGNLGNTSAFGKAFHELKELGMIDKMPRMAVIQAHGSNPLYQSYK